jgi:hypothetical protein
MQAGIKTANAMRPMTEVMNHAQVEYGMRPSDIPRVRRSSVVVMKFRAPRRAARTPSTRTAVVRLPRRRR